MKAKLIVSNILSAYIVVFITSNLEYEYFITRPRSNVWKPGWKQADACKLFILFKNFADLNLTNYHFFLISRICAYLGKNTPFFAKVGTSVVYVLIGSGGRGDSSRYSHVRFIVIMGTPISGTGRLSFPMLKIAHWSSLSLLIHTYQVILGISGIPIEI